MNKRAEYILFAFLTLFAIGVGLMIFEYAKPKPGPTPSQTDQTAQAVQPSGLGSEIYTQSANPVPDSLPVTNPLDVKVNPFE